MKPANGMYEACELLLLNGAPTNAIRQHCLARFQMQPSVTTVGKWRIKIGVPSRVAPKAFPDRKPVDYFTAEERASLALHHKFNTLLAGCQNTQQRNAA